MFSILIKEQLQVSSLFNAAPIFSKSDSQLFRTSPPPKDHFRFQSLFTFSTLSIALTDSFTPLNLPMHVSAKSCSCALSALVCTSEPVFGLHRHRLPFGYWMRRCVNPGQLELTEGPHAVRGFLTLPPHHLFCPSWPTMPIHGLCVLTLDQHDSALSAVLAERTHQRH